jgi:fucose 4-O-acetylase-like acetyltransferase
MKEHLIEVDYIRVILIFALVGYHAFAPFCGAWVAVSDMQVPIYSWIGEFFYSFMLEAFVFVSGYVFGYQVRCKGQAILSLRYILNSKFKRYCMCRVLYSVYYIYSFLV